MYKDLIYSDFFSPLSHHIALLLDELNWSSLGLLHLFEQYH